MSSGYIYTTNQLQQSEFAMQTQERQSFEMDFGIVASHPPMNSSSSTIWDHLLPTPGPMTPSRIDSPTIKTLNSNAETSESIWTQLLQPIPPSDTVVPHSPSDVQRWFELSNKVQDSSTEKSSNNNAKRPRAATLFLSRRLGRNNVTVSQRPILQNGPHCTGSARMETSLHVDFKNNAGMNSTNPPPKQDLFASIPSPKRNTFVPLCQLPGTFTFENVRKHVRLPLEKQPDFQFQHQPTQWKQSIDAGTQTSDDLILENNLKLGFTSTTSSGSQECKPEAPKQIKKLSPAELAETQAQLIALPAGPKKELLLFKLMIQNLQRRIREMGLENAKLRKLFSKNNSHFSHSDRLSLDESEAKVFQALMDYKVTVQQYRRANSLNTPSNGDASNVPT